VNDHDEWVIDSFWGDEESEDEAEYWDRREEIEFALYELDDPDGYLFEPQGRIYGKGNAMTNMPAPRAPKLNLEKALRDLQRQQEMVEKLLRQTQRFPDEFPVGTVLKFKHVFMKYGTIPVNSKVYDYVALRADNGFWYLTCAGSKTMNWEQLVEFIGDEEVTVMVEGEKI